jgi:ferritin-like metal-binding protein YciE
MKIKTMDDLFLHSLRDLYNAEKQLTKALPKMVKNASSEYLRDAIQAHLEETQHQVERLEEIFQGLDKAGKGVTCKAMQGLVEEGAEALEIEDEQVRDAGIIAAAQKVEHYEIASYGTARTFAQLLGNERAAELLQQTLDEEKAADEKLTEIATSEVNAEAEAS